MESVEEFALRVKNKYPEYRDVDDRELVTRVINKYPEYKDRVNIEELTQPVTQQKQVTESQGFKGAKFSELAEVIKGTEKGKEVEQRLGKEIKVGLTRFAPFVIPVGTGTKLASKVASPFAKSIARRVSQGLQSGGINLGARFAEELSKDKDIESSAKEAAKTGVGAMAITLGLGATGDGISYIAKKLAPFTKKTTGQIQEILTSIPADDVVYALNKELAGKTIFKQPFEEKKTFNIIGKRVQKAINFIDKKAGEAVAREKEILKNKKIRIKTEPIINKLDELVEDKFFQGETSLLQSDLNLINLIREDLKKEDLIHVAKLNIKKNKIYNYLKSTTLKDKETVKNITSEGEGILKQVAKNINNIIGETVPSFRNTNREFSKIRSLRERLRTKLKDENVARNVKNLYNKDSFVQDLFFEVDELAPKNLKFRDKLRTAVVRDAYQKIAPGRGGGSGSGQGVMNILRGALIGFAGTTSPVMGAFGAALTSPAIGGKTVIKSLGATPRIGRSLQEASRFATPVAAREFSEE